ncbi:hypothetical protein ACJJTC_007238 [Scirpophaga incertulas]
MSLMNIENREARGSILVGHLKKYVMCTYGIYSHKRQPFTIRYLIRSSLSTATLSALVQLVASAQQRSDAHARRLPFPDNVPITGRSRVCTPPNTPNAICARDQSNANTLEINRVINCDATDAFSRYVFEMSHGAEEIVDVVFEGFTDNQF